MQQKLTKNWVTIGTGVIANELVVAFRIFEWKTLWSCQSHLCECRKICRKYGIEKVYDEIDDVFTDPAVDIIYISTPHNTHIHYLTKSVSRRETRIM